MRSEQLTASAEKLCNLQAMIRNIWFVIALPILMLEFYAYRSDNFTLLMFNCLFVCTLLVIIIYSRRKIRFIVNSWLHDAENITEFRRFYDLSFEKSPKFRKGEFLQEKQIADGIYYYYIGDFEQSLFEFNKVKFQRYSKNIKRINTLYYSALSHLHLEILDKFQDNAEELLSINNLQSNSFYTKLQAISKILNGEDTHFFKTVVPASKLEEIERFYYLGLFYLKQGDKTTSIQHFKKIEEENEELFYVREAKKCLEELQ